MTLKRLQPQQKAQAKIKIQQLLYDMEFPQPPTESVPLHPRQEPPTHILMDIIVTHITVSRLSIDTLIKLILSSRMDIILLPK